MTNAAKSTRDVARLFRLTAREIDNLTRNIRLDELPPVVRGRRQWEPQHVARLRAELEARTARAAV